MNEAADSVFARRAVLRLSSIEFWERYSFYNMFALLPLYVSAPVAKGGLALAGPQSLRFFGLYLLLVSVAPVIGGALVGPRLSARNALRLGALLLFCGHVALALSSLAVRGSEELARPLFYAAVVLVASGNGLFKPVISTVVARLPHKDQAARDAAFTAFFLFINIGGLAAVLLGGWLAQAIDWTSAFAVAALGMLISLLVMARYAPTYIVPFLPAQLGSTSAAARDGPAHPAWLAISGLLLLMVAAATIIYQSYGFVSLFTEARVDRTIAGFEVPTAWFVAINPLTIMVLTPVLVRAWRNGGLSHDWSVTTKVGIAFLAAGTALLVIAVAAEQAGTTGKASATLVLATLAFIAVAELFVTPAGTAAMSRLVPGRSQPTAIGAWSAAGGLGGWFSGQLGAAALGPNVFATLAVTAGVSFGIGIGLIAARRLLARIAI